MTRIPYKYTARERSILSLSCGDFFECVCVCVYLCVCYKETLTFDLKQHFLASRPDAERPPITNCPITTGVFFCQKMCKIKSCKDKRRQQMASVFFFLFQVTTCDFQRAVWHPHPVGCVRFISIRIGEIVNSLKSPVTPRLDQCGTRQIWIWKKKKIPKFRFDDFCWNCIEMMWRQNYVRTISLVVFFCCWVRLTLVLIIWTSFFISFSECPCQLWHFSILSLSLSCWRLLLLLGRRLHGG